MRAWFEIFLMLWGEATRIVRQDTALFCSVVAAVR